MAAKLGKMGHEKAAREAEMKASAELKKSLEGSHGHTCVKCIQTYRHFDSQCKSIGLAYNGLCDSCIDKLVESASGFEEAA